MSEETKKVAARLGLKAMQPLRLEEVKTTDDLLRQMANTAFTGRKLGEAVDVLEQMLRDDCFVVMTLTGAMTMAGLRHLIIEMIEKGWIHCLVSTGALVGHGMVEDLGLPHYKVDPSISDETYFTHQLNRVYDVLEPEENLTRLEEIVRKLLRQLADESKEPIGTGELLRYLGEHLPGNGILQAAVRKHVPIYIPAFTDSELGLDFAVHKLMRERAGKDALVYDGFRDLYQFTEIVEKSCAAGKNLGIFTIGGGVPRNWVQQVGPYVDVRNQRLAAEEGSTATSERVRFKYGVRVCPDPVHYGHLSGCTYSEGVSWGKFIPPEEGGRFAEVLLDATVAWPLLVQALIERGL